MALIGTIIAPNDFAFKNRLINGDMRIDQRNNGAAVTVNAATRIYGVDRFFGFGQAADGVFTIDQDPTAPVGFVNSTKITVTTADASVGASQFYVFGQSIEGFNISDLGWGAVGATSVTLSFQVRSSLTGTFSGAINNSAANRSYPFTFTINAANTFEYKTITIDGDTSGTWLTTNGIGINVFWDLGSGSSNIGPADVWAGAGYYGATGGTKLISTNGATFYITGVQLEAGSVASPFERRPFGAELALCQRYFESLSMYINTFSDQYPFFYFVKRAAPTVSSTASGFNLAGVTPTINGCYAYQTTGGTITITVSAEL